MARLVDRFAGRLRLSVSATTRSARPGETEGEQYHFLSPEDFAVRQKEGGFLECMEVFGRGYWYGTLLDEVRPSLAEGKWVILEIDVDGAQKVRCQFPDVLSIFIQASSDEELERRLRDRKTDSEEAIRRRLEVARRECAQADSYRYQVVNSDIETTVGEIANLLTDEGLEI